MELRSFLKGEKGEQKIEYRLVIDLKPHPENESIYGKDEDVSDLIEKIKKSKRVDTLTVTDKNIIISGHRRWKACKKLDIREVPVQVEIYSSTEDELEALVLSNASREKTPLQKAREGMILEEVEKTRALERSKAGVRLSNPLDGSSKGSESGIVRDIVASKVGFKSGRQYERTRNVVKRIDGEKEKGNTLNTEVLTSILNRAPSTAEEFISKVDIETLDTKTKEQLISGEKSAYKVIAEEREKTAPTLKKQSQPEPESGITQAKIQAAVNEYNAISRGEIPMPSFFVESNVVINEAEETFRKFRVGMAQLNGYEHEIKTMSDEEFERFKVLFNTFEESYNQYKNILLRR